MSILFDLLKDVILLILYKPRYYNRITRTCKQFALQYGDSETWKGHFGHKAQIEDKPYNWTTTWDAIQYCIINKRSLTLSRLGKNVVDITYDPEDELMTVLVSKNVEYYMQNKIFCYSEYNNNWSFTCINGYDNYMFLHNHTVNLDDSSYKIRMNCQGNIYRGSVQYTCFIGDSFVFLFKNEQQLTLRLEELNIDERLKKEIKFPYDIIRVPQLKDKWMNLATDMKKLYKELNKESHEEPKMLLESDPSQH